MSKRQQIRERNRRQQTRNRIIMIIVLVGLALLVTAFFIYQNAQTSSNVSAITPLPPVTRTAPLNGTSMGDPNAKVKMDVYEDFQCSGCMYYTKDTEPQVIQQFVDTGKILYTFHYYPFIDGGQGESHDSANAAACANEQSRFWDYHDILYLNWKGENVGSFTPAKLKAYAESLKLDMTAFNSCFASKKYAAEIQKDVTAGSAIGVPPTPGIFVNGKMVTSSAGANLIPSVDDIGKAIAAAAAQ